MQRILLLCALSFTPLFAQADYRWDWFESYNKQDFFEMDGSYYRFEDERTSGDFRDYQETRYLVKYGPGFRKIWEYPFQKNHVYQDSVHALEENCYNFNFVDANRIMLACDGIEEKPQASLKVISAADGKELTKLSFDLKVWRNLGFMQDYDETLQFPIRNQIAVLALSDVYEMSGREAKANRMLGFNLQTMTPVYQLNFPGAIQQNRVIGDRTLIWAGASNLPLKMLKMDWATGQVDWQNIWPHSSSFGIIMFNPENIVMVSRNDDEQIGTQLTRFDNQSGKVLWNLELPGWPSIGDELVAEDYVYMLRNLPMGNEETRLAAVYKVNWRTGELLWQTTYENPHYMDGLIDFRIEGQRLIARYGEWDDHWHVSRVIHFDVQTGKIVEDQK